MGSKFRVILASGVVAIAGAWLVAPKFRFHAEGRMIKTSPAPSRSRDGLRRQVQLYSLGDGFSKESALGDSIHQALTVQRQLGPADRDLEDEIGRTLRSVLENHDVGAVVSMLSEEDLQSDFGFAALARWAVANPHAASKWLAGHEGLSTAEVSAVIGPLCNDSALFDSLLSEVGSAPIREQLLAAASRATLPNNPARAAELAERMRPGTSRNQALAAIADVWATCDPIAAHRWIAGTRDVPLRDRLTEVAVTALASMDPVQALHYALDITSDAKFEETISHVVVSWAHYQPERAHDFLASVSRIERSRSPSPPPLRR